MASKTRVAVRAVVCMAMLAALLPLVDGGGAGAQPPDGPRAPEGASFDPGNQEELRRALAALGSNTSAAPESASSGGSPGDQPPVDPAVDSQAEGSLELSPADDRPVPEPARIVDHPGDPELDMGASSVSRLDEPVEMVDERTEMSKTFDNGDGSFSTEVSPVPLHVERDGSWVEIDTSLRPSAGVRRTGRESRLLRSVKDAIDFGLANDGDGTVEIAEADNRLAISERANADELVEFEVDGEHRIAFGLEGSRGSKARVEDATARFDEVLEGVDLTIEAHLSGVKETLVLDSPGSASDFVFDLDSRGLEPRLRSDTGDVELLADGVPVAVIPRGWAEDATGERAYVVEYSLRGGKLVVSVDKEWLAARERVWPVLVDPSIVTISPVDSYTNSCYADSNYWTTASLQIGKGWPGTCVHYSYLWFPDASFPEGFEDAHVIHGDISLWNSESHQQCDPNVNKVYIYRLKSGWYPPSLTWNTAGSIQLGSSPEASQNGAFACGGGDGGWFTLDTTDLVRDWWDGSQTNYGIQVRPNNKAGGNNATTMHWKRFNSAEQFFGPQLGVHWTPYSASYEAAAAWDVAPSTVAEGELDIEVTNTGSVTWGTSEYHLSYQLFTPSGSPVTSGVESIRSDLPQAMSPGETRTVTTRVEPLPVGDYIIKFAIVRDYSGGEIWFSNEDGAGVQFGLSIDSAQPVISTVTPAGGVAGLPPTFSAVAYDPDGEATLQYQFRFCEDAAMSDGCQVSSWGLSPSYRPVGDWMGLNETYYWSVTVREGSSGPSTTSPPVQVIAQVDQPDLPGHLGADPKGEVDGGGVNVGNGNFTSGAVDASVGTVGPDLGVVRNYNSLDSRVDGWFGTGWTSPYDMVLDASGLIDQPAEPDPAADPVVGDFDGDGAGDVLWHTSSSPSVVWRGTATSGAFVASDAGATSAADFVVVGDLDGDGRDDVVFQRASGIDEVWYGEPGGAFDVHTVDLGATYTALLAGDFDGNGSLDLFGYGAGSGTDRLFYGTSTRGSLPNTSTNVSGTYRPFVGDFDADGSDDIFWYRPGGGTDYLWYGSSLAGVFESVARQVIGTYEVAVGDYDADGHSDIVWYGAGSVSDSSWWGTPSRGTFGKHAATANGTYSELVVGDYDGDGFDDILWSRDGSTDFIWYGSGTEGSFTSTPGFALDTAERPQVGDLDADGRDDLVGADISGVVVGRSNHPNMDNPTPVRPGGHVAVRYDDGHTAHFGIDSDGTFAPPPGRTGAELVLDDQSDTWILTEGTRQLSWDNTSGRVTEIREVVDQTGTVDQTLDLIDTDSDGLVDRIDAQPSDRSLHLAWSATDPPHVTEVSTDPEPGTGTRYTWTYEYTGDQLDKVCGPRDPTECTTYIWGSGGGEDAKITEIRSPGNDTGTDTTATKVTYHDDGTAATAENGAGDQWAYTRDLTTAEGLFHPVEPTRVASLPAFVGSETHNVDITAALGSIDPADVQSAVVRITVDNATNDRFFMPHLPGEGTGSSFVNYVAGETNDMTIPLAVDDTGVFALTAPASLTRADVYVDVVGWYAKAGVPDGLAFHSTQPMSVYDSDLSGGTFGSGETRSIDLSSHLAADAQVALVNLVSVEPDTDTALSAWSADGSEPAQSQAQGWAGEINKNVAWVPVSADHEINVKHLAGTGHVAVELLGWFAPPTPATPGLVYRPLPSGYRKLLGSQPGSQVGPYSTPWATQATRAVPVAGVVGIPGSGAEVVVGSIVPVEHHGDVKLTTHTADQPRSDVTAARGYTGEAAADTLHANIGGDGHMLVFNELANTDVVVHAYGWYQLSDTVATATTPHSQTLTHTFDYTDRLIETAESDPDTGDTYLTTYRYNARGNLDLVVDPTDRAERYWYDEVGRRIGKARQLGSTADEGEAAFYTTWEYDDDIEDRTDPRFAEPIAERDPRSTVSFDPDTGAPSSTDDTYKTTFVRDAQGRTITETRPGVNTNWEGDKAALLTDFVYTDGTEAVPVEFGGGTSPAGLLASRIDPGGVRTDYVHDAAGDLRRLVGPLQESNSTLQFAPALVTEFAYDHLGRQTTETEDPEGRDSTSTSVYDEHSRIIQVLSPEVRNDITGETHQRVIDRSYDGNGNLQTETTGDAAGNDPSRTTSFDYDPADRLVRRTDPTGLISEWDYNAAGQIDEQRVGVGDPGQITTRNTYTARGLPETATLVGYEDPIGNPGNPYDVVVSDNSYDPAGRLLNSLDAIGRTTTLGYSLHGFVDTKTLTVTDGGSSRDITIEANTYDPAGNLTKAVGAGGTVTEYDIDPAGTIFRTDEWLTVDAGTPTETRRATVIYDDAGNPEMHITQTPGRAGHDWTWDDRDIAGRPRFSYSGVWTDDMAMTEHVYDDRGLPTQTISPEGRLTDYTYDELGQTTAVTGGVATVSVWGQADQPGVRATASTGYDTFGEVDATVDANGEARFITTDLATGTTTYTEATYSRPDGQAQTPAPTTVVVSDVFSRPISETDRSGATTSIEYDRRDQPVRITQPAVAAGTGELLFRHDAVGRLVESWDQIGAKTSFEYDGLDNVTTETLFERYPAPADQSPTTVELSVHRSYDDASRLLTESFPVAPGETTTVAASYLYSAGGELVSATDAAGIATGYSYENLGQPDRVDHPDGTYTELVYDGVRRLATETDHRGNNGPPLRQQTFGYDRDSNPTSVTDAKGRTTDLFYDGAGQLVEMRRPGGTDAAPTMISEFHGYDAVGNPTKRVDGNAQTWWTTYNTWGLPDQTIEPATSTHPALSDRTWTYSYDPAGRPDYLDAPGTATRDPNYDELGRVISESAIGDAGTPTTRSFGYDLAGRMTSYGRPGGLATIEYNDRSEPLRVNDRTQTTYSYDHSGQPISITDAAGATTYTYDPAGRPESVTSPLTGATTTSSYDPAGRLATKTTNPGGLVETHTYDDLSRLETQTVADDTNNTLWSANYTWDPNNNLTAKTIGPDQGASPAAGAGTHTYTYDRADRLTAWDHEGANTDYSYDNNDNQTTADDRTLTYNERNQLEEVDVAGGGTTIYTWTPRGTRDSAQTAGEPLVDYTFDGFNRLTGDGTTANIYDDLGRLRDTDTSAHEWRGTSTLLASAEGNTHTYTPSGQLHTTSDGTDAHHAITDQHSDLVAGVDLVTTATDLTLAYTPWGQPTETTGTPTSTLGYQSDHISPSGLINMNGRWYDPTTGTFTSRDAIDDPALANRFGYTPANPLSYNDLSGNAAAAAAGVAGVCLLTAGIGCVVAAAAAVVGVSYAAAVAVGWLPAPSWPKINLCPWCDSGSPRAAARAAEAARAAASQRAASARLTGAAAAYAAWRANNAWSDRLQSQVDAAGPAGGGAPPVPPPFPPFPPPVPICLTNVCWPASVTTGGGSSGSSGAIETLSLEQIFGDWFISWSGEDLSHLKPNLITEVGEITYGLLTGDLDPSLSGTAPDRLVESILVAVGITAAGQPGFNAQGCFSGTSSPVGLCNDYMEQIADLALSFRPGGECSKAIQSGASAEELIACAVEMAASAAGAATSRGSAGSATRSTSIADDLARAGCSFSGATLVLMADGSRKPIEDIEVGDKVLATDPEAGQTIAREVTHLWVHNDTVVDLIVDGDVITTTEDHPFWNETDEEWQRADQLDEGDLVRSADGDLLTVEGLDGRSARTATAYNLTVDDIHTYYVGIGDDSALVHNTCGFRGDLIDEYGFNPGSHVEAHHVVPQGHSLAKPAQRILGDDVIQDAGLNGVFLRRGEAGLHNATLPDAYVSSVNQRIVDANRIGGRAAALDELAAMRDELIFLQSFIP